MQPPADVTSNSEETCSAWGDAWLSTSPKPDVPVLYAQDKACQCPPQIAGCFYPSSHPLALAEMATRSQDAHFSCSETANKTTEAPSQPMESQDAFPSWPQSGAQSRGARHCSPNRKTDSEAYTEEYRPSGKLSKKKGEPGFPFHSWRTTFVMP